MRGAAILFVLVGCAQPRVVQCEAVAGDAMTIDMRACAADRVTAYVENTGDDRAALAVEWRAIGGDGSTIANGEVPIDRLDPDYGAALDVRPIVDGIARVELRVVRIERTPSDVVWSDIEVHWDEPVPHGAGVEVRTRHCEVADGSLTCELGVRNFGAKAVDVSLRIGAFPAQRSRVYPGDAIVLTANGPAPDDAPIVIHGTVRSPPKRF